MDAQTVRAIVLIMLTIQNAGQSIVITQSRRPNNEGQSYDAAFAVLLQELIKIALSLSVLICIILYRHRRQAWKNDVLAEEYNGYPEFAEKSDHGFIIQMYLALKREIYTPDAIKMMVPAALYVIQNHLQLLAASNTDATTFSIFSQLKIISTAIFTVSLMGRVLNRKQWMSVMGLFFGVVLVQYSPNTKVKASSSHHVMISERDSSLGLLALTISCILSGFAGVYTEKVITKSTSSIFANSLQMSLCSMLPAASPIIMRHLQSSLGTSRDVSYAPFGAWAWMVVIYNVWGGFIVAMTMKVSSSLAKSFATSIAVVLTFIMSYIVLHESFSLPRIVGASVVIISVYTYSAFSSQVFKTVKISGLDQEYEDYSQLEAGPTFSVDVREKKVQPSL